jgi:hypothetical protein
MPFSLNIGQVIFSDEQTIVITAIRSRARSIFLFGTDLTTSERIVMEVSEGIVDDDLISLRDVPIGTVLCTTCHGKCVVNRDGMQACGECDGLGLLADPDLGPDGVIRLQALQENL